MLFRSVICILLSYRGQSQLLSVTGYVKNNITGEMKKNATVFETVSGVGTITNSEGYYRLLLKAGQKKLEITSPGFKSHNLSFNLLNDTVVSVELFPKALLNSKPETENELLNEPIE